MDAEDREDGRVPVSSDLDPPPSLEQVTEAGSGEEVIRWEIVDAREVEGVERPKVVEWDELQQELARFCSLSAALKKAEERKAAIADRLGPLIEIRRESLQQTSELDEMKQNLVALNVVVGDLIICTKRTAEGVELQREQLSDKLRNLLAAANSLSEAHNKLQGASELLLGENGYGRMRSLQKMLRTREQQMVAQVAGLYPVKVSKDQLPVEKIDPHPDGTNSNIGSSLESVPQKLRLSSLTILGLQITALPIKKTTFFTDKKELQRSATALGYVAHALSLIASYLDVPLRYPLHFRCSRSSIYDHVPTTELASPDLLTNPVFSSVNTQYKEFPLYFEGQDATRASYAIFLLNKDLEQLLNFIGAESLGPRHVLANLKELLTIIQSQHYIDL